MPSALRTTLLLGAVAATLAGVGFAALSLERRGQARWTDDRSVRVAAEAVEPRRVLWQPATPAPGALNSDADEYEPRIGPDGITMVLVRRRPDAGAELCASRWTPEGWTPPAPIAALGSAADELGPELSSDGRRLYFYSDRDGGFGGYDLWVAHALDGGGAGEAGWSAPINLGPTVNSEHNEYGPALAPDGRTLFFASNRPRPEEPRTAAGEPWSATLREPRSRHDYDLYAATMVDGEPAGAAPLATLNSAQDEGAPAVSPAGDFLWFASDRPGGLGGFDLYRTRLRDGVPTAVERLDEALNSPRNELDPALSADGFRICFSSDRAGAAEGAGLASHGARDDAHYDLWCSVSREVHLEQAPARSLAELLRTLWAEHWPWILALLLCALLLALLARLVSNRAWRTRFGRLSILAQCLLLSLLLHSAIAMLLTIWKVGSVLSDAMGRSGAVQVSLVASGAGASPAEELLAPIDPLPTAAPVSLGALAAASVDELLATSSTGRSTGAVGGALSEAERFDPPQPATPVALDDPGEVAVGRPVAAPSPTDVTRTPSDVAPPAAREELALTAVAPAMPEPALAPAAPPATVARGPARVELARSPVPPREAASEPEESRRVELPVAAAPVASLAKTPVVQAGSASSPAQTEPDGPAEQDASIRLAMASAALPDPPAPSRGAGVGGSVDVPVAARAALPAAALASASTAAPPASSAPPSVPMPVPDDPTAQAPHAPSQESPTPVAAGSSPALRPLPAPGARPVDLPQATPPPRSVATGLPASTAPRAPDAALEAAAAAAAAGLASRATRAAELPLALPEPVERFAQRSPEGRGEILAAMGGTAQTEQAVALALAWFARHQAADGRWSAQHFEDAAAGRAALDRERPCEGAAEVSMDLATTSLALLCYLSAGHTHLGDGPHREQVAKAVRWICSRQSPDGDLRRDARGGRETMYGQTIAAVALCEAYAMTKDAALADPAGRAARFVVQQAERSRRGQVAAEDTSVIGWQVMVLASARRAGLGSSDESLRATTEAARRWIESVRMVPTASGAAGGGGGGGGGFAYRRGEQASVAMTAEAMVVRQLLAELDGRGGGQEREALEASARYVLEELPRWAEGSTTPPTTHHLYYATMALFHQQGDSWQLWNEAIAPELVRQQRRDGCAAGSWDPSDRWAQLGGRVYQTAICTLSLEVYYRYRPASPPR